MFVEEPLKKIGWGHGWIEKFKENETKNKKRAFRSSAASPSKVTLEKLIQSHHLS